MPLSSRYRAKSEGNIKYDNTVVVSIIEHAVGEVPDVFVVEPKGIAMNIVDKKVSVSANIIVGAKCRCTMVAFAVQENIKQALENMTEFTADKINVNIVGVELDMAKGEKGEVAQ